MARITYNSAFTTEISNLSAAANIRGSRIPGGLLTNKVTHLEYTTDLPAFERYVEDHIRISEVLSNLKELVQTDAKNLNDTLSAMNLVDSKNAKKMQSI